MEAKYKVLDYYTAVNPAVSLTSHQPLSEKSSWKACILHLFPLCSFPQTVSIKSLNKQGP